MPHISVDYSERVTEALDRRGLGLELTRLAAEILGAKPEACRARFRRVEEPVVGEEPDTYALVFVEFHIFPGRPPEAKARLTEAVLAVLPGYLAPGVGKPVQAVVNIVEIDSDCYRDTVLPL